MTRPGSQPDAPRVVWVTGVSRGIGRALAVRLAALGHRVVGCARSADALATLARELGRSHRLDIVDVCDDAAVAAWVRDAVAASGAPDLLVNNAGVIHANAPLWEIPRADFDRVLDVNVKGVANVLRHAVPPMLARGRGVIVNMSSGWGRSVSPDVAGYCASKWAVEGLTRALAAELPRGLAAVPVNPGIIDTDMLRSCFGGDASSYPDPDAWALDAAPRLLALGPAQNGRPVSI